jgi:hypothetical protein
MVTSEISKAPLIHGLIKVEPVLNGTGGCPPLTFVLSILTGCFPDRIAPLDGEHVGAGEYACQKRTPLFASLSILGVSKGEGSSIS